MKEAAHTYHNKQGILERMLNLAAIIQGVNDPELLDPIAILLIESLAEEVYHLSAEVDHMEARVLNRLSSMLVSETAALACPAHSLLHVSPRECRLNLTTTDSFILDQEQKKEQDKLSLYPVCDSPVYHGGVRYFIFDRYLFSMDRELTKTLITRSGTIRKGEGAANSFWIALELDNDIEDIENLSFYVNLSAGYKSPDYLKQLLRGKWKCAGEEVPVRKGLYSTEEHPGNPMLNLFQKSDHAYRINREIKKRYDKYYVTIDKPLCITGKKETFPAALRPCFPEAVLSSFQKEMLWFEILCPPGFTEEIIRSVEISINIIPVACKRLVKEVLQVNRHIPVIPLHTRENESFLSVHSLSDSDGTGYYDVPLSDSKEEHYGIYTLRKGGYERFDANDAKEFLANMTNLINKEAASLFKRNNDSKEEQTALEEGINAMIRNLTQVIHSEKEHAEVKNYLLVEQQRETEIYFLEYWTAGWTTLESIRENIPVRPCPDLLIDPSSVYLIRSLSGGKRTPSGYEKYSIYRKSLTEHPLLVTPEDIRRFCLKEFSEIIEQVEVRSGHRKNTESGSDFVKTTDVYLRMRKFHEDKADKTIHRYIEQVLRDHSPATFNYRIIII